MKRTLVAALTLVALGASWPVTAEPKQGVESAADKVNALADELLEHLRETNAYVRLKSGLSVMDLDDITPERAQLEAQWSSKRLERIDAVPLEELTQEQWLLARTLRHTFASGATAMEDYWLTPVVTPYSGGYPIQIVHQILGAQPLNTEQDLENYLHLLDEYEAMLAQIAAKAIGQAERGLRVPRPAIPGVRAMLEGLRASVANAVAVRADRMSALTDSRKSAFQDDVARRITESLEPGYDRILRIFDDSYVASAPDGVGVSQYAGGRAFYLRRIKQETGLDLAPEEIYERGLAAVDELEEKMRQVRAAVGFQGSRDAFHAMLQGDSRFFAKTAAEVEERYLAYISRIEPLIPRYFSNVPSAPYGVKRLDPAAEPGMTYGYYQAPTPTQPTGYYNYNGSALDKRSLIAAQHLIYHELIPGHHFHVALQTENKSVHPVREFLYYGAFTEGWAEYAASLADEMGLLTDPYDRYGQYLSQVFLASRLVVDTGMNYLNWPLEKARQYLRDHTFESDVQIDSESLRYSTDLYAQALGYRLGFDKFWELRRRAEAQLGDRFDVREFHAAVVGSGALPLDVLDEHVNWFIRTKLK